MLDDAIVMAMEELLVIAMAHAHGELVGLKCETERVCLDPMILSESPALQKKTQDTPSVPHYCVTAYT